MCFLLCHQRLFRPCIPSKLRGVSLLTHSIGNECYCKAAVGARPPGKEGRGLSLNRSFDTSQAVRRGTERTVELNAVILFSSVFSPLHACLSESSHCPWEMFTLAAVSESRFPEGCVHLVYYISISEWNNTSPLWQKPSSYSIWG